MCSLCRKNGFSSFKVNKSTCPFNIKSKNINYLRHNIKNIESLTKTDSLLVNWDVLNNRIQSELAANLWGKDYRYYIRLNADKQFQTALENFDIAKSFVE